MESRTVKERLLDELREAGRTKEYLLAQFGYEAQQRGAASVLAYLVRSDQAEIINGVYFLTGREPQKVASKAHPQVEQPPAEPPVVQSEPELQWALWHDGDLLIRRGEINLVLTAAERERISAWLQKVAA